MKKPLSKSLQSLIKMRTALNIALEKKIGQIEREKPETWPTTRELAEACDMSIYQARRFLLKLVEQGDACVSDIYIDRSRRWFAISKPADSILRGNDKANKETISEIQDK